MKKLCIDLNSTEQSSPKPKRLLADEMFSYSTAKDDFVSFQADLQTFRRTSEDSGDSFIHSNIKNDLSEVEAKTMRE